MQGVVPPLRHRGWSPLPELKLTGGWGLPRQPPHTGNEAVLGLWTVWGLAGGLAEAARRASACSPPAPRLGQGAGLPALWTWMWPRLPVAAQATARLVLLLLGVNLGNADVLRWVSSLKHPAFCNTP